MKSNLISLSMKRSQCQLFLFCFIKSVSNITLRFFFDTIIIKHLWPIFSLKILHPEKKNQNRMDLILISMIPWLCIFDRFEDFTSSVTHSWSRSKTLHSSSVGQLKQLHSYWIYPVTDQTFRCCNSNILSLIKIQWKKDR